jgi:hypothetical protein
MSTSLSGIAVNCSLKATMSSALTTVSGNSMLADQTNIGITYANTAGSSDGVYTVQGTVVSGTPVVIDFNSLTDPFGIALTVVHISALKISNTSATGAGNLSFGGGTDPIFASFPLAITPTDFFCQSFNNTGLIVVASTAMNLTLTASTGTVSYQVTALVRSA